MPKSASGSATPVTWMGSLLANTDLDRLVSNIGDKQASRKKPQNSSDVCLLTGKGSVHLETLENIQNKHVYQTQFPCSHHYK